MDTGPYRGDRKTWADETLMPSHPREEDDANATSRSWSAERGALIARVAGWSSAVLVVLGCLTLIAAFLIPYPERLIAATVGCGLMLASMCAATTFAVIAQNPPMTTARERERPGHYGDLGPR